MNKVCPLCSIEFHVKPSHFERRKYCSKICFNISKQGKPTAMLGRTHSNETKARISAKNLGFKHSEDTKKKMLGRVPWNKGITTGADPWNKGKKTGKPAWNSGLDNGLKEEESPHWLGDDVGYGGLHGWVKMKLGKPTTCKHCKKTGLTGNKIHWANKSQNYLRDTSDWLRLCASCHRKYDNKFRLTTRCRKIACTNSDFRVER